LTTSASMAAQAILLATNFVLARILRPDDFGLVAMVLPILGFVWLLQEFGISLATVQKKTLTSQESSFAFWLNVPAPSWRGAH